MRKNKEFETLDDEIKNVKKEVEKNEKKVLQCTKVAYLAVVFLGLSIFVGLPIGIFASIPALTIASAAIAGLQVVNQIVGLVFGSHYNSKSIDAQEELMRLLQEQGSTKSIDDGNEIYEEKTQKIANMKTKTRTKKAKTEKTNDDSITVD